MLLNCFVIIFHCESGTKSHNPISWWLQEMLAFFLEGKGWRLDLFCPIPLILHKLWMLPVIFCCFYLWKIGSFLLWLTLVYPVSAVLEKGAKWLIGNCCIDTLQHFCKCSYFSFILLFISSMYYYIRVPGVHPNICSHNVGYCKTKSSVVLALKRRHEWSKTLEYKDMETLLGEGIRLEDILFIHETLVEQHLEKG